MIRILIFTAVAFFFLAPQPCFSATDYSKLIEEYLEILERGPTVLDSQRFDGPEDELHFELLLCKERKWEPAHQSEECISFTRNRATHAADHPSLHLNWLRAKIPDHDVLTIIEVQDALLGAYPYKRIVTILGGIEVVFGHDTERGPFGLFFVLSIDGIKIDKLLEQDIQKGLLTSSLLLKSED